jgi:hypothetical protein
MPGFEARAFAGGHDGDGDAGRIWCGHWSKYSGRESSVASRREWMGIETVKRASTTEGTENDLAPPCSPVSPVVKLFIVRCVGRRSLERGHRGHRE